MNIVRSLFFKHGVIKDDLSDCDSSKNNLQCLITTTNDEYLDS